MRNRLLSLTAALALALGAAGSASAGTLSENLDVSIQTYGICEFAITRHISVSGLYGLQNEYIGSDAGQLQVRCNPNITYTVEPGDGLYFGQNTDHPDKRAATGDMWGGLLAYSLQKGGSSGIPWGTGADAIFDYGNGDWQAHSFGVMAYDMNKLAGDTYTDQVVLTLTYF
ncbi:spore coat protein U domain-containing protein [Arenimonas sp. MALMAid1274]|uniref:spore coat protein U domain-containing protein n=1 Tax=Arenimonas sp. MALMAid1274 TaxID=3411630 RepID=UPI003BA06B56